MKYVYILEFMQLDSQKNTFWKYRTEVYSSKKSLFFSINQIIETNKGFDVELQSDDNKKYYNINDLKKCIFEYHDTYNILNYFYNSVNDDNTIKKSKFRLVFYKTELRTV